jgi:hypothetical protein
VLLRLAYIGVTTTFALPRLLPMSDQDKDTEILAVSRGPERPPRAALCQLQ